MSAQDFTPITPEFDADDVCEISGRDMALLLPWMRAQLTKQRKHEDNADLCEALTSVFRTASEVYGADPGNQDTCICYG
ncbi:hypothetical protein [Streptomyces sp. NPDC058548]|uniref:hypothetical protein n=1 Tax=Streptomyces sp. NPDC058548 TaxID=3346545 RepID=UPI00366A3430